MDLERFDDPAPPEPDDALLARVVGRGRQRRRRQRALIAAIVAPVVVGIIGAGVAVAQHDSAGPPVAVQPPADDSTSTSPPTAPGIVVTPGTTSPTVTEPLQQGPGGTCNLCAATTIVPPVEDPRTPHAGDFSGTVTADATSVVVGDGIGVALYLHSIADHEVDASLAALPRSVALVCTNDLTPDGHTNRALLTEDPGHNLFFVTNPPLAPGADGGVGPWNFVPTADDVGTMTCEGVIIATTAGWASGSIMVVSRITAIAPVSFTVLAAAPATTTPPNPTTTTTTVTP